jgi:hypothetical protein
MENKQLSGVQLKRFFKKTKKPEMFMLRFFCLQSLVSNPPI